MKNLILLREARGLRQEDMAKMLGISRQAYCTYENDRHQASYETLIKLADFFNVSVDYLIDRGEKKSLIERPNGDIAENYIKEYKELFRDPSFCQFSKIYKAIDREKRIAAIAYVIGYLQSAGINIEAILSKN